MDSQSLQIFVTLAQTQHFGKTAALCHLSASAISRHVQRLEASVGQLLVERDNRQVHLTPAGRHFLTYAKQALEAWQQVQRDLNNHPENLSGEISVYGSVTASYSILTRILPVMRARYAGVELKLRTGDQANGIERVLSGQDDCAIVAKPTYLSNKLEFLPLERTPLHLIGPKDNSALSQRINLAIEHGIAPEWANLPLVLAEYGLARERLLQRLAELQQIPFIYAQVGGHEAVVAMVGLGLGVGVVPELVIQHSPMQQSIHILPWLTDLEPFTLGLCALRERLRDPLLQALWCCAKPDS